MLESIQWIKKSKKKGVIVKLDFREAYDSVRWCFVDHVLDQIGFGQVSRRWVQDCIATASMSMLIDGSLTKPFNMEKGLRQNDPSPFLFILVVEVLNKIIGRAVDKGLIQGLKIGKNKVNLTHL